MKYILAKCDVTLPTIKLYLTQRQKCQGLANGKYFRFKNQLRHGKTMTLQSKIKISDLILDFR